MAGGGAQTSALGLPARAGRLRPPFPVPWEGGCRPPRPVPGLEVAVPPSGPVAVAGAGAGAAAGLQGRLLARARALGERDCHVLWRLYAFSREGQG